MGSEIARVVLAVINKRKSVRSYVPGQAVSKEDLTDLVKAGMAAPTAKNAQTAEFIVINDMEIIKKLAAAIPSLNPMADAGSSILLVSNTYRHLKITSELWVQDLATSAENILLAAEAMGYGACWGAVYPTEERIKVVREILGFPEFLIPFCFITVGKPTGFDLPQDKWNPRRLHWNKWSQQI